MSTSETVEYRVDVCPCGDGKIMKSVTSQDNPWSSWDIRYYLDCKKCGGIWRVENGSLVSQKEDRAYREAYNKRMEVSKKIDSLLDPLVDSYFNKFAAPSMAAEHREMQRLDITSSSIRDFRKGKNTGKRPSELCYARRNMAWTRELLNEAKLQREFDELQDELNAAEQHAKKCGQAVRRIAIQRS